MEGQALPPPLDAVASEPLADVDEPLQPSMASAAEAAKPTSVDGLAPTTPAAVAPDEPFVADELLPLLCVEEEDDVPDVSIPTGVPDAGAGGVVLTDELRAQIVKQVEYYFSDENLPTDEFMLKFVSKNKQGFVPIGVIASFRRMKKLVKDLTIIEAALRTSSKLVVSSDGKRVRRLHPLPLNESKDAEKRTVVVDNLPSDFSAETIREKFGSVGMIVNISICDPHSVKGSAMSMNSDFILSNKVHALVEYETVEAAEKAATDLNDERNWRTGMKVRLLAKQNVPGFGKHNQCSEETVSRKNNRNQPLKEEQHTTSEKNSDADSVEAAINEETVSSAFTPEDENQHQKSSSKGGRKGRYRSQGKYQAQQNAKGQGGPCSESLNKPIPGPRMPDGTRGFTMGRGTPLLLKKSVKPEE